jgi:hypothetical protein
MENKKFKTISDMGSVKIFTSDVSFFFNNGFGDGENIVQINNKTLKNSVDSFLGHFTIKTKAYLSEYDCKDNAIYEFEKGRYFVHLVKEGVFNITKEDEELDS